MRNFFHFFFILMFPISVLASCSSCQLKREQAKEQEKKTLSSCLCPKDYNPVCGQDKMTYSNACSADCAGVKIAHEGSCVNDLSNP